MSATTTTATVNVADASKEGPDITQDPQSRKISIDHHDEKVNFEPSGVVAGGASSTGGDRPSTWFARLGLGKAPAPGKKSESGDVVVDTKPEETAPAVSFFVLLFR
jgi:hypothetical protein